MPAGTRMVGEIEPEESKPQFARIDSSATPSTPPPRVRKAYTPLLGGLSSYSRDADVLVEKEEDSKDAIVREVKGKGKEVVVKGRCDPPTTQVIGNAADKMIYKDDRSSFLERLSHLYL